MKKLVMMVLASLLVSGCATPGNIWKTLLGVSTQEVEDFRATASVKVFDYDYKTCYEKTEGLLKKMPFVSIYTKNDAMIAVNYINPDTTPVGIFFKSVDPARTQVEVSSPSTPTKEWVAKNIFSETVLEREKADIKL